MLRLDINLLLTMINLIVLYLLLRKFLIGPIIKIMEKRASMIADGLHNADEQQKQAGALKLQYENALSGAKEESLQIVEQARTDAKLEYARIVDEADTEAGKMVNEARATIAVEREQTLREMKTQVAGLALGAASKIVSRQLNAGDSEAVYDEFLKDAGDIHDVNEEDE